MAAIDDLLKRIADDDLRVQLQNEFAKMQKRKTYGFVYENHLPEATVLYDAPVRRGCKVILRDDKEQRLLVVKKVAKAGVLLCSLEASLKNLPSDEMSEEALCEWMDTHEEIVLPVKELAVVAQFGEPIYPYLVPMDEVCNAPDSDLWHSLIQADNFLALQLLAYLYPGMVDCIYIDPPYNTGAKDWKYNNNYVDSNDKCRSSKWMSFMEKRLKLAKKLLNPKDSVLIVTIDEKEYLHLGCLLEEMFPEARIQMVCDVINPHGANRKNMFARAEEYIYFIFVGQAAITHSRCDMLNPEKEREIPWQHLIRGGQSGRRSARPNQFYPIFFSKENGKYVSVGKSLLLDTKREDVIVPDGCFAVWPINSKNGNESIWGIYPESFAERQKKGYIKFGKWKEGSKFRSISFLQSGMIEKIESNKVEVLGKDEDGALILGKFESTIRPLSVWNQTSHSASEQGTSMLNRFFPSMRFTFPKSLYSTKDAISFATANKPNALILDFFAGSGTTLHAVNLLNAEDGGHRRCIMVTNNEVSDAEAKEMTKRGLRPGDEEWEALGIAQYVNWPRTVCSILGCDVNGNPLKGNYIGSDIPMSDGFKANAKFFKLGMLNRTSVALGRQLKELLPLIWMKSGAVGKCPRIAARISSPFILRNNFAILIDETRFSFFARIVNRREKITHIYIITDSDAGFREMSSQLNAEHCFQLYKDYLDNFRINCDV